MWPFREAEELTECELISRRCMTWDFGGGDRPSMRIGTGSRCWENRGQQRTCQTNESIKVHRKGDPVGDRVDKKGAVAAQRSVTDTVQSVIIKQGVEGDERGW